MKCSVCAQNIPEDQYSEHLESEHGVTDDPTAVLIQHLSGLGSKGEDDADEGLPDEEPSDADADAFEQFLAAHPAPEDEEEHTEDEEPESEPEPEPEPEHAKAAKASKASKAAAAAAAGAGAGAAAAGADEEADAAEDAGEELTDEDEAEFERMLATYPDVDLRKGKPKPPADEPATEPVAAAAVADGDEKTFAVWDEARGATAEDEDLLVVAPPAALERARRRRQAALLGLGAAIILIAIAVIYLLTRDTGTKKTTVVAPVTLPPTTVSPTFLPGPRGGAPSTVPDTTPATQPPVTAAPPATPTTTAAPPPPTTTPSGDPASRISFSYSGAECTPQGGLSVFGTIVNNNSGPYTFSYTITILRNDGTQQGTATGSVSHLPPGGRSAGTIGTGSCTYPLTSGPTPRQTITSITPG